MTAPGQAVPFLGFLPGIRIGVDVDGPDGPVSRAGTAGEGPRQALAAAAYYIGSAAALALIADAVAHRHTVESADHGGYVVTARLLAPEADGAVYALTLDDAAPSDPYTRAAALTPEWEAFSIADVPVEHAREQAAAGLLAAIGDDDGRPFDFAGRVDDVEHVYVGDDESECVPMRARWEFAE